MLVPKPWCVFLHDRNSHVDSWTDPDQFRRLSEIHTGITLGRPHQRVSLFRFEPASRENKRTSTDTYTTMETSLVPEALLWRPSIRSTHATILCYVRMSLTPRCRWTSKCLLYYIVAKFTAPERANTGRDTHSGPWIGTGYAKYSCFLRESK